MTTPSRDLQAEMEDAITAYGSAIRLATQCFEERRMGERKDDTAEMRYWKQADTAAQHIRDLLAQTVPKLRVREMLIAMWASEKHYSHAQVAARADQLLRELE